MVRNNNSIFFNQIWSVGFMKSEKEIREFLEEAIIPQSEKYIAVEWQRLAYQEAISPSKETVQLSPTGNNSYHEGRLYGLGTYSGIFSGWTYNKLSNGS